MIKYALLLPLIASCAEFGYVKMDLMGEKTSPQACQFNEDFTHAKCVEIEAFLKEFDEALKKSLQAEPTPEKTELMKFNNSWNDLTYCKPTEYGWYCEGP